MKKRIITGVVLLLLSCFTIYSGDVYFFSLVAITSLLTQYEILKIKNFKKVYIYIILSICLILILTTTNQYFIWNSIYIKLLTLIIIVLSLIELIRKKIIFAKNNPLTAIYSLIFVSTTLPYAILIRNSENGFYHTLIIICTIAATDSFAYFIGKNMGKRKLTSISPKKTLEGSLGGTLLGFISGMIITQLYNLPTQKYLLPIILIVIISQCGDIHESLIKRTFNKKDSSNLLPGHGGIYDRVDGYIFSLPIFYFLIQVMS